MIKSVVFDFDGTLSSEREYIYGCFKFVVTEIEKKFGINNAYIKLVKLFNESWYDTFGRLLKQEKVSFTDQDINDLVMLYRKAPPVVKLYDDTLDIIKFLKNKEIKLAILTNGYYEIQNEKIRISGLEDFFDIIEIPDLHGKEFWKPDIRRILFVIDELGISANETLYIGDSDGDYKLAKALNMPMAFIERDDTVNEFHFKTEANYVFESLNEIKGII